MIYSCTILGSLRVFFIDQVVLCSVQVAVSRVDVVISTGSSAAIRPIASSYVR